jgi:hypothetical protein
MHILIAVIAAVLLRIGLQWIFGKGWGLFITFLWWATFVYFGLIKFAPPFPIHLFKGASFTAGTFSVLGIIFAPFIIAKIGIEASTQNKAKAWVGGFLFCFMSLSIVVVWALVSSFDYNQRQGNQPWAEDTPPPPPPPPPGSNSEPTKRKEHRTKAKQSVAAQPEPPTN